MPIEIIETHAHIYSAQFDEDRNAAIERAKSEGVSKILMPNVDVESIEVLHKSEENYPGYCVAMMGLHPCSVKEDYKEQLATIEGHLNKRKYIAVGEIGLDYYWDLNYKEAQIDAFKTQIEWGIEQDLPIAIHSREANADVIKILKEYKGSGLRGVLHCFSGNAEEAKELVELGFYLGIGGVLTFKNSGLKDAIREVAPEHLLLETDCPYLAPMPNRGKRNEPSFIKFVLQHLSELYMMHEKELAKITTQNANDLFKL